MEQQIIIAIKTPITPEAHEKLEDKLKVLFEKEGLETVIDNLATGNSTVTNLNISNLCLKGKYVIMKTKAALNLDIIDCVYFCDSGFGCDPNASDTKIYGYFVTDPERVYMRRYDAVRLAKDDEVKQAQERFRKNKTWALENWRKHLVDSKKTFLDILKEMKERGGFE